VLSGLQDGLHVGLLGKWTSGLINEPEMSQVMLKEGWDGVGSSVLHSFNHVSIMWPERTMGRLGRLIRALFMTGDG
jgi:hypothetical protein